MQRITIGAEHAGQRLDKFLHRYLKEAGFGFLHKMLRKKNITLNSKKADGSEMLERGDVVAFFFSEETFRKFRGDTQEDRETEALVSQGRAAFGKLKDIRILYEDRHVLLMNKPAGILSQKAEAEDLSLNEWLIGYLLERGEVTPESLGTFRPSVCNRLDRNTSGIVIGGKTLYGSREMSRLLRDRSLHKYYMLCVEGRMEEGKRVEGYLYRDRERKYTRILQKAAPDSVRIETVYRPVRTGKEMTLVEAQLITGRTHQIRAHLASEGFPLVGDYKYGDRERNDMRRRQYGITCQLLHAHRLVFPVLTGELEPLSEREVTAPLPDIFHRIEL